MIPFHIATPQGCDIQTFYGSASSSASSNTRNWRTWNKPVGVSHIYMLLIGGGGDGTATLSGGSGAVTVWYGAAQHVPDVLQVYARGPFASFGSASEVAYLSRSASFVELLQAHSSTGAAGGIDYNANYFTASGFFQSVEGQDGVSSGSVSPSNTTFLSAGAGTSSAIVNANYGYSANLTGTNGVGYFQLQPIIVGVGSANQSISAIGCGARVNGTDLGPGMVLIASW